jgi:hypothetical protein
MHSARAFHTATLLADGQVLVAGGTLVAVVGDESSTVPGSVLASAELYDPAANTWRAAAPMASAATNQSATLLSDGRVLVIGGIDRFLDSAWGTAPAEGLGSAEVFDPATGSWSQVPGMLYRRISPSATLLPNGQVLVVGDNGVNEKTAEIFNPTTVRWSPAATPAVGRAGHVAVLLHSGVVLVAGGLGETRAELFDWQRSRWAGAGTLATIRSGASATVLGDGRVLVVGGFGTGSQTPASAELYDPHGGDRVGTRAPHSAVVPLGTVGPFVAASAMVLALALWLIGRRRDRRSREGVAWVD